jgi:hypothetical protein
MFPLEKFRPARDPCRFGWVSQTTGAFVRIAASQNNRPKNEGRKYLALDTALRLGALVRIHPTFAGIGSRLARV